MKYRVLSIEADVCDPNEEVNPEEPKMHVVKIVNESGRVMIVRQSETMLQERDIHEGDTVSLDFKWDLTK